MKSRILTFAACTALVASVLGAAPAFAHERGDDHGSGTIGTPVTLADGLVTPLSLAVDRWNNAYVSENFTGSLTKVNADGTRETLVSAPGEEISAVSARRGTVYFAQVAQDHSAAVLKSRAKDGTVSQVADLWAFENAENPDQINTYGFDGLDSTCAAQFDPAGPPAEYSGVVDTHPYASLALSDAVYVADAGGNAILRVDYDGSVSAVAVMPAGDPILITAEIAAAVGIPACAADHESRFEPVPTDVELGPDGWLYVTTSPGGPEDASLGARGSVYRVDPDSGDVELVATGFVGATGLAVARGSGTIYVAEHFGGSDGKGQVSVLESGSDTPSVLTAISSPAAIELRSGDLYLTTDSVVPDSTGAPQPIGKVTRIALNGDRHSDDSSHDWNRDSRHHSTDSSDEE